jgi:hypothetical protein
MRLPAHVAARPGNEACLVPARPLDAASRRAEPATELQHLRVGAEAREFHAAAVVGSIIFFTSVIFVAGKPLTSACLRMMASSLAR